MKSNVSKPREIDWRLPTHFDRADDPNHMSPERNRGHSITYVADGTSVGKVGNNVNLFSTPRDNFHHYCFIGK